MRTSSFHCLITAISLLSVAISAMANAGQQMDGAQSQLSPAELALLRPVVLPDLKKLLMSVGGEPPSAADLEQEFKACKFSRLTLPSLGPSVLVEANAYHGVANAAMLNIYLPSHGTYRRILEARGFGPRVIPNAKGAPDLVFGWTSGVCYATYYLYRYKDTEYGPVACDQEDRDATKAVAKEGPNECPIEACSGGLPMFPDPWPAEDMPEEKPKPTGIRCQPAPEIEPATAMLDGASAEDYVQFMLAARSTGDCYGAAMKDGVFATSDPVNTAVTPRGRATCLGATPTPAQITYSGSYGGRPYKPAILNCK